MGAFQVVVCLISFTTKYFDNDFNNNNNDNNNNKKFHYHQGKRKL